MTRTAWIAVIALLIVVIGFVVLMPPRPASVQISTDAAKVSIGAGGVSVSVAPSQP